MQRSFPFLPVLLMILLFCAAVVCTVLLAVGFHKKGKTALMLCTLAGGLILCAAIGYYTLVFWLVGAIA